MTLTLTVRGMSCDHCTAAITAAVAPLPGVSEVTVDVERGLVTVAGDADEATVVAAIEDTGYDVDRAA
jgi:copper ion binding protein